MHIFNNFSKIPKSIFFDNNNLPISFKNADISAVDNFSIISPTPKSQSSDMIPRTCRPAEYMTMMNGPNFLCLRFIQSMAHKMFYFKNFATGYNKNKCNKVPTLGPYNRQYRT